MLLLSFVAYDFCAITASVSIFFADVFGDNAKGSRGSSELMPAVGKKPSEHSRRFTASFLQLCLLSITQKAVVNLSY